MNDTTTNVERIQREDAPLMPPDPPAAQFWREASQRAAKHGLPAMAVMFRNIGYTSEHPVPRIDQGGVKWD